MRAKAFMEVGGSPTYTLTEDFALGMELKKYGWQCRYVQVKLCAISNTINGFQVVTSCQLSLLAPSKSLISHQALPQMCSECKECPEYMLLPIYQMCSHCQLSAHSHIMCSCAGILSSGRGPRPDQELLPAALQVDQGAH